MTEMTSKRHVHRRAATAAWHTRARGAVILAVVVVAACDESVVAPPAAVVAASPRSALLSPAPASDRDILIALYETTDGPNWLNSDNWLTDAPLGDWYGVDTDASGRVVRLDLAGMWDSENSQWIRHGLSGAIPAELGGLANLETLSLGNNELTGPIPAELGGANLEWLSGPTSGDPGGRLKAVSRRQPAVRPHPGGTGRPGQPGLNNGLWHPGGTGRAGQPGSLWLNSNQGPIPPELGNLANVWQLGLAQNALSGPIPPELGGLANLEWLYLGSNELTGTVPLSFLQLSQLQGFGFGGNAGLCLPADLSPGTRASRSGRVRSAPMRRC